MASNTQTEIDEVNAKVVAAIKAVPILRRYARRIFGCAHEWESWCDYIKVICAPEMPRIAVCDTWRCIRCGAHKTE